MGKNICWRRPDRTIWIHLSGYRSVYVRGSAIPDQIKHEFVSAIGREGYEARTIGRASPCGFVVIVVEDNLVVCRHAFQDIQNPESGFHAAKPRLKFVGSVPTQ